jgi:solute carrier family 10 (sodium/bile acid cotransporter), member 7
MADLQAKGNVALALMLCVVSNLVGIVTVPFILKGMLSKADTSINAVSLLIKLAITILVPLVVGKLAQDCVPGVKGKVKAHKTALSLISNASLSIIVWQTISAAQVCVARGVCAGARRQS